MLLLLTEHVLAFIPTSSSAASLTSSTVDAAQAVGSLIEDVLSSTAPIELGYQRPKSELATARDRFERIRSACVWEQSWANYEHDLDTGKKPVGQRFPMSSTYPANRTRMDKCSLADATTDSRWRIARVGPLFSTGGYDWHTLQSSDVYDPLDMNAALQTHGRVWITAFDMSALDANKTLLPLPPIHIHHSHLAAEWSTATSPEHGLALGFSHADTACHPDAGGPLCQMFSFPPGYGVRFEEPLGFDALLNDARDAGSPALEFFFEIAVAYTAAPVQRPLGLTYSVIDASPMLHPDDQWFGTFEIPAAQDAINWGVTRYEYSGRLLNTWLHTHEQFGFSGMWNVRHRPLLAPERSLTSHHPLLCAPKTPMGATTRQRPRSATTPGP